MNLSVEEVQKNLEIWLLDEGYSITKVENENAFFSYSVRIKDLPSFNVLQLKAKKDSIVIASGISLGENEMKQFDKTPEKEKQEVLWNLRMNLLRTDCRFRLNSLSQPFNIQINKTIYYDGLSKNSFFGAIERVQDAVITVIFTMQRKRAR